MTRPHGLTGKGYRWLIVLIYAIPAVLITLALEVFVLAAPFDVIAIIVAAMIVGLIGGIICLAFGSQSYDGRG